jgi:hypothetical protein
MPSGKKKSWAKQAQAAAAAKAGPKPKPAGHPHVSVSITDTKTFAGPGNAAVVKAVTELCQAHPRHCVTPNVPVKYVYGTAGFRAVAGTLHSVCVRMGMFASLLSRLTFNRTLCVICWCLVLLY